MKIKKDITLLELPDRIKKALRYLEENLDKSGKVILFGSKTRGEYKDFKDFDLALSQKRPLSWREFALLKNEVEELAWPYKVDLIDLNRAPVKFREIIENEGIILQVNPSRRESRINMNKKREKSFIESANEALDALSKAIEWLDAQPGTPDRWARLDTAAKRFEVSFEYLWNALKVALEKEGEEVYGPKDSIQKATGYQWSKDIGDWIEFLQARNADIHDYFGLASEEYAEIARPFEEAARPVLSRLPLS